MHNHHKEYQVPLPLQHSFFFPDGVYEWQEEQRDVFAPEVPFFYEFLYYQDQEGLKPWENPEHYVPLLLEEWKKLKEELATIFARREIKKAHLPMKLGLSLFLEMLYWINDMPVSFSEGILYERCPYKPVNTKERLEFILGRPALYHSYIQLTELMVELEKQFAKKKIIMKKATKNVSLD